MSYAIHWLIEGRLIYIKLEGAITPEDMINMDNTVVEMLNSTECTCYTLSNFEAATSLPPIVALMRQVKSPAHPRYKLAIAYGQSGFIMSVLLSLTNFLRVKFRFFRSSEEALRFLQMVEPDFATLETLG